MRASGISKPVFSAGAHVLHPSPEGPERHLDAARQKLPQDNYCRAIALAAGPILKEEEKAFSCGGEAVCEAFLRENFREGNCGPIAARQWRVISLPRAFRCLAEALWQILVAISCRADLG